MFINAAQHAARALRRRHHREPGRLPRTTSNYSIGTVTALNPVIGYDQSTELAAEAMKTGRGHPRAHPREEDPDRGADRQGARPGRDDGTGAVERHDEPRMQPVAVGASSRRSCWRARRAVPSARQQARAGGRLAAVRGRAGRASGQRQVAADRGRAARPSIVHLSGAAGRSRAGTGSAAGFRARSIGFDDGAGVSVGPGGLDRRARRPDLQPPERRARCGPGAASIGTITGGTGRYAGLEGELLVRVAVRRATPETATVQGRAVGLKGRLRSKGPADERAGRRRARPGRAAPVRALRRLAARP